MRPASNTDGFCLLTIKETADRLRLTESCVYKLIAEGKLPVVAVGLRKGYRIDIRDLDAFVCDQKFRNKPEAPRVPRPKLKHLKA